MGYNQHKTLTLLLRVLEIEVSGGALILILARTRACQPLDRLLKGSLDL